MRAVRVRSCMELIVPCVGADHHPPPPILVSFCNAVLGWLDWRLMPQIRFYASQDCVSDPSLTSPVPLLGRGHSGRNVAVQVYCRLRANCALRRFCVLLRDFEGEHAFHEEHKPLPPKQTQRAKNDTCVGGANLSRSRSTTAASSLCRHERDVRARARGLSIAPRLRHHAPRCFVCALRHDAWRPHPPLP